MPANFGLLNTPKADDYLGPLQALALGRQAKVDQLKSERDQRFQAARDRAFQQASGGDYEGAQRTALAGGDIEGSNSFRGMAARTAAGNAIRQSAVGGLGGSVAPVPLLAASTTSASVAGLIGAQPRTMDIPGTRMVPLGGPPQASAGPTALAEPMPAAPAPMPAAPAPMPSSSFADHNHPGTIAVGHAIATGQINPTEAWAHLYQLDPEMGEKTMTAVKSMDALRVGRLKESNDALASAAKTLLHQYPEGDQRAAAAQRMLPQMAAHGVTPDMLATADLSDKGLAGIIGQSIGIDGLIKQANDDRKFGLEVRQQGEVERHNRTGEGLDARKQTFEESKPVSVGYGNKLIRPDGDIVYDGEGTAGGDIFSRMISAESGGRQFAANGQPLTSGKGAVGIVQVMPGTAPEAARLAGVAWDAKRYANDAQYNATIGRAYYNAMVQKYGGDETKAVAAYNAGPGRVDKAIARGGANWVAQLPAETKAYVAKVGSGGAQAKPEMLDAADFFIASGGKTPPGFARDRAAQAQFRTAIDQRLHERSMTMTDVVSGGVDLKARQSFLNGWNGRLGGGTSVKNLNVAVDHIDTLQQAARALANGQLPLVNRLTQTIAQSLGKPTPTNFDGLRNLVADEVTKGIIGTSGGVTDREATAASIRRSQSPQQLFGMIGGWHHLMTGQLEGLRQQYQAQGGKNDFNKFVSPRARQLLEKSGSGGNVRQVRSPQEVAALPSGAMFRTPDGRVMRKR